MKRLWLFLSLAVALALASTRAEAITIELSPSSATIGLPGSVDLDVLVTGLGNEIVSAYDLFLSYDPSIVTATAVTFGPYLGDPLSFEVFEDTVFHTGWVNLATTSFLMDDALDLLQRDASGRLDPLLLATISFDAVGLGTSSVVFDASLHPLGLVVNGREILDANNDPIGVVRLDLTALDGEINVVGQPAPEPSSLLLMALGLLALRRRQS